MEKEIILPCYFCGGDGYNPHHPIQICPTCDGLGSVTSKIQVDEKGDEIVDIPAQSLPHREKTENYELIPF